MPNNYNVRTVTRPAKPRSKALQGLPAGTSSGSSAPGGLLSGYVTLSTDQIITGKKTFANDVIFGAAKEDGSYSRLLIPSTSGPGICDLYVSTEPVDGEVPSASGGIDEDELWTILGTSGTQQIDPSHIPVIPVEKVSGLSTALSSYATKEWVEGKGYLTSVSLSTISDLHASWDSLLQSAPDFYSKGSVYSKSEADGRFVGIANEQTVTGRKTFSALLTASAGISGTNADLSGYICATKLYLPYSGGSKVYDICISTQPIDGEAPSEGGGINEDELWTILGTSGTQQIDLSHIPAIPTSKITGLDAKLGSYLPLSGGTMTGKLTVDGTSIGNALDLVSENATETYLRVYMGASYKAAIGYHTTHGTYLYNRFTDTYLGLRDNGLAYRDGNVMWDAGNDGSGSGLDADLLDGYQANDLMILGRSVNMLSGSTYSGYIPPLVLAMMRGAEQVENPTFLNGSNLGVYNNAQDGSVTHTRMTDTTAGNGSGYVLKIHSSASASPGGGGFTFSTSKAYRQATCVFRAKVPAGYTIDFATNSVGSGGLAGQWLTERTGTGKWEWYACTVYFGSSPSTSHFYYLTPAANVDWYLAYAQVFYNSEALYVGMQAQKADRLTTSRTLWGRPFDGTGNVSGDMTGVGRIDSSLFELTTAAFHLYDSASHAKRLTFNWTSDIARIYAINNSGSGYYDMSLGQTPGNSAALYFDASAACWGIGTTSPAYKLDVAGTLRATDIVASGRLFIPSSEGNQVFDAYIA